MGAVNAVFSLSLGFISIYQWPLARSKVENHLAQVSLVSVSLIWGKGKASLCGTGFGFLHPPSFHPFFSPRLNVAHRPQLSHITALHTDLVGGRGQHLSLTLKILNMLEKHPLTFN